MGETKGNKIRLKKFHFSVLDELLAEIDEEALQEELEVKKEQLESILNNDYSNMNPPEHLKATAASLPDRRLPVADLPERSRLGWYTGR